MADGTGTPMEAQDVLDVLAILADAGVTRAWLTGGWGVDALLGAQHRDHADLDLLVDQACLDTALTELATVGFDVTADARPSRIGLTDHAGHHVDLHPLWFGDDGTGWQTGVGKAGIDVAYEADQFSYGWIAGTRVDCVGPEKQVELHTGYPPTDTDRSDMARLHERFTIPLPDDYR